MNIYINLHAEINGSHTIHMREAEMKINIRQISEATGFSPATVSNALNHKKGVNRETAEAIFKAASEMGYISAGENHKIRLVIYRRNGMIIDGTPFFTQLIDGFENECRQAGFEMSIVYLDRRAEDYAQQVQELISDPSTGIALLGSELTGDDFDVFRSARCPMITFDYFDEQMQFSGIVINNIDSARAATGYLLRMGHNRIGYLCGNFRIRAFQEREAGYRMAMSAAGAPAQEEYRMELSTTMDGAYADMKKLLADKKKLPTAFFSDNDMIALGAMKAMQEAGIRVPEDVSVIGFDDLPYSEICSPRLTSLKVPKQEMGAAAAKCLIEVLNGEHPAKTKTEICTEFIERDSVQKKEKTE